MITFEQAKNLKVGDTLYHVNNYGDIITATITEIKYDSYNGDDKEKNITTVFFPKTDFGEFRCSAAHFKNVKTQKIKIDYVNNDDFYLTMDDIKKDVQKIIKRYNDIIEICNSRFELYSSWIKEETNEIKTLKNSIKKIKLLIK